MQIHATLHSFYETFDSTQFSHHSPINHPNPPIPHSSPVTGVGHMIGTGMYVLTGTVTRDIAGPAIIILLPGGRRGGAAGSPLLRRVRLARASLRQHLRLLVHHRRRVPGVRRRLDHGARSADR